MVHREGVKGLERDELTDEGPACQTKNRRLYSEKEESWDLKHERCGQRYGRKGMKITLAAVQIIGDRTLAAGMWGTEEPRAH